MPAKIQEGTIRMWRWSNHLTSLRDMTLWEKKKQDGVYGGCDFTVSHSFCSFAVLRWKRIELNCVFPTHPFATQDTSKTILLTNAWLQMLLVFNLELLLYLYATDGVMWLIITVAFSAANHIFHPCGLWCSFLHTSPWASADGVKYGKAGDSLLVKALTGSDRCLPPLFSSLSSRACHCSASLTFHTRLALEYMSLLYAPSSNSPLAR